MNRIPLTRVSIRTALVIFACGAVAIWALVVSLANPSEAATFETWSAQRDVSRIASLAGLAAAGDVDAVRREAETGDPEAQTTLGLLLCERQLYDEAALWLEAAALKGHFTAIQLLIVLAAPHGAVLANPAQTRRWVQVLERGRAPGYNAVAALVDGPCVPTDARASVGNFVEAAFFPEFPGPFYILAGRYEEDGNGVIRDLVEAFALVLTARQKVDSSDRAQTAEYLAAWMRELEAQMTPAEVAAARTRSREWLRL